MDIMTLNNLCEEYWWGIDNTFNKSINKYTMNSKKQNEEKMDFLIDSLISLIRAYPSTEEKRIEWKKEGSDLLDNLIQDTDEFKLGVIDHEMKEDFINSTRMFVKEGKKFDKAMKIEDIGQAMRNVWIVNLIQKSIGHKIEFNRGIFGYSMLYPYTDNYLDDSTISLKDKKEFNSRFRKRLEGKRVEVESHHEKQVYDLVSNIEELYSREKYPKVYEALLSIHSAQEKSLIQQREQTIPYEKNILGISIEKGGTSVMADGYLIYGDMTGDELDFVYKYGFLLQICDDLQDIEDDLANNHNTILTQLAGNYPLDTVVNKLINFTVKLIDEAKCFVCENHKDVRELIKNNCITMILIAIVKNKKYFTKGYIKDVEDHLLISSKYINSMNKNMSKKFRKLKASYNGVAVEDIICELFIY